MKKAYGVIAIVLLVAAVLWGRKAGIRIEYPTAHSEETRVGVARELQLKHLVTARRSGPAKANSVEAPRTRASVKKEMTAEEIFCELEAQKTGVPMGGELRLQTLGVDNPDGTIGNAYLVQSSDCPPGLFSIMYTNEQGQIAGEVSCRSASAKDLALDLGIQAEVVETDPPENEVDLAITGAGYFVVQCERFFRVTRLGRFVRDAVGSLRDPDNCRLWTKPGPESAGKPMHLAEGEDLNAQGCRADGVCVGVIDPRTLERENVELNDDKSFNVTGIRPDSFITPKLVTDAIEDVENPEHGAGGWKNWDLVEPVSSDVKCPPPAVPAAPQHSAPSAGVGQ